VAERSEAERGDGSRLSRLFRMRNAVRAYVHRRCANPNDVEEIVADTYVVAWQRIKDVPVDDHEAFHWLRAVARRILANAYRSARRTRLVQERVMHEASTQMGVDHLPVERLDLITAWQKLALPDQRILVLVGLHGLNDAAIAARLGCSHEAARVRIHRARRRYEEHLSA
jgi:RNA polymerase sigma factor (sigma-70 family)